MQSGDVKAAIKSWESILQKKGGKSLEVLKRAFHSWAEVTGESSVQVKSLTQSVLNQEEMGVEAGAGQECWGRLG